MTDLDKKPTAYEIAEANVFAYLDKLATENQPIPGTRKIREACGVSQSFVCPAVKKWKEQHAAQEAKALAEAGDEALSEAVSKAFDLVRQAVAKDVQVMREKFAQTDRERVADFDRRESELLDRVALAEEKAYDELVRNARLTEQLRLETEARKSAERDRDTARADRDRAESEKEELRLEMKKELAESQAEIERLTAIVADLNPKLIE